MSNQFDFQTRPAVGIYMASLLPMIIQTAIEPTPGLGNLVYAINKVHPHVKVTTPVTDYWKEISSNDRFDAAIMNPPFTPMETGYQFLYSAMHQCEFIVALMPWLTVINGEKRLKRITDYGLVSVTHLPRNVFPGARVQCCILLLHKGYKYETKFIPHINLSKYELGINRSGDEKTILPLL